MKLLQMLECWKIKSEEETLLKNQILSENNNFKRADTMETFKLMLLHGMKNLTEPKSQKLLSLVDPNSKSKDWFFLSLPGENLKNI